MIDKVSTHYVLNMLAGRSYPEPGSAYDYMKRCFEGPEHNQPPWRGPRIRGVITRVAHALGYIDTNGTYQPSPLDHVDAYNVETGKIEATYRGAVEVVVL